MNTYRCFPLRCEFRIVGVRVRFIGRALLVEVEVSWSGAGADSLPGFGELMDVQGEGGHCSFTDNTSLLTDLHKPTDSDKLTLLWIMMMAGFFVVF